MASRRTNGVPATNTNRPPAKTPEDRENQLIVAAEQLAEKQLLSGEASAQVITHYLKLGSSRERLEQQRLKNEVRLLEAKRELMESEKRTEELIVNALEAMRTYTGNSPAEIEADYDEY